MSAPYRPRPLPPLTRAQRRLKRAILAGAIVRLIAAEDDDGNLADESYLVLYADPSDPIGVSYTESVQTRTLLPLRWRGLLDEDWETPRPR